MCIRPTCKLYSILTKNDIELKKAKGIAKAVTDKLIKYNHYHDCLFKKELKYFYQQQITPKKHVLYTVTQNKLVLSPLDTKRYVQPDGVQTLAFGHYTLGGNSVSLGTIWSSCQTKDLLGPSSK